MFHHLSVWLIGEKGGVFFFFGWFCVSMNWFNILLLVFQYTQVLGFFGKWVIFWRFFFAGGINFMGISEFSSANRNVRMRCRCDCVFGQGVSCGGRFIQEEGKMLSLMMRLCRKVWTFVWSCEGNVWAAEIQSLEAMFRYDGIESSTVHLGEINWIFNMFE